MPATAAATVPSAPVLRSDERMPEIVRLVVEAVVKYPVPETVSAVDDAYGKVFAAVAVEVMAPAMPSVPVRLADEEMV